MGGFRTDARGFKAFTGGYGVNAAHGEHRHGVFGEFTVERGANSMFGRAEWQQTETDLLVTGEVPSDDHADETSPVSAFTIGAARNIASWRGFDGALGAEVVFYRVPDALTETHGEHPVSFQVFFRLRLPSSGPARMWNMRMSQGHRMDMGDHR